LLKIIAGLVFPKSGECRVNGHDAALRIPEALEDIFFLPEEFELPPVKIERYVYLNAPFYSRFDYGMFEGLVKEFELDKGKKISQFSYGQKKKFLIAFGLATKARMLLMDEPTNGLDIPSKSQFRKVIASSMQDDQIIVISTHQVRDLQSLIDPIIIMESGRIIFNQTIYDINSSLVFENLPQRPDESVLVYSEDVMGGFATISRNIIGKETRIDIELLFNAVVSNHKAFNEIFKSL
jgi:ABC-2 type transport system ATP-binding protein